MTDIFSKEKRSEVMRAITGKDTKPEVKVRKHLFARGFRYRKNVKSKLFDGNFVEIFVELEGINKPEWENARDTRAERVKLTAVSIDGTDVGDEASVDIYPKVWLCSFV